MGATIIKMTHVRSWERRRNKLVCKLLDENPTMTRTQALGEANKQLGKSHPAGKQKKKRGFNWHRSGH